MDWLNILRIIGYILIVIGPIITVTTEVLKSKRDDSKEKQQQSRIDTLIINSEETKKLLQPFRELSHDLFPHLSEKDALDSLKARIDNLETNVSIGNDKLQGLNSQIATENKTIKTLTAAISIRFSGNWINIPYPEWFTNKNIQHYMKMTDSRKRNPDIDFKSETLVYKTISQSEGLFDNTLSILPGEKPLGELVDVLKQYDTITLWLPFTSPENIKSPTLFIKEGKITFYINGKQNGQIEIKNSPLDISYALNNLKSGLAFPSLEVKGDIFNIMKIRL